MRGIRFAGWLVILILLTGCVATRSYVLGKRAAADGRWDEAFFHFRAVVERAPEHRDAAVLLDEAARQLVDGLPRSLDLETEIALIRHLAASGEDALLATALDRCTVTIPEGAFLMGSDVNLWDERPLHAVTLDAYEMMRYEVAHVQYQRFVEATGHKAPPYWDHGVYPSGQADVAVVGVPWEDANAYCAWRGWRLPTEAEWEKACRGTDARVYPWGNAWEAARANVDTGDMPPMVGHTDPHAVAWGDDWERVRSSFGDPDKPGLQPVGAYPAGASPYGVLDMAGNVSEWVADYHNWDDYADVPTDNPLVLEPAWNRALRGSSWYPFGIQGLAAELSRCSKRNSAHRGEPDTRLGFRCTRSLGRHSR